MRPTWDPDSWRKHRGRVGFSSFFFVTTLALASCNGSGKGGSTTIIQTVAHVSSATTNSGPSPSSTPSVSSINDPKKLCRVLSAKGQEIVNAVDGYWDLTVKGNWSWSDPKVSDAADHAKQVVNTDAPFIEGSIGQGIPRDVADAWKEFADSAEEFGKAIDDRSDSKELNPLNTKFRNATDVANHACGY